MLTRIWPKKIKHQLILGVTLVHALMMSVFIFDLVYKERAFLIQQLTTQTHSLAQTVATNTTEWMLSNNVVGLQEIIQSQSSYENLRYAMIFNPEGLILAHTNQNTVGKYLQNLQRIDPAHPVRIRHIPDSQIIDATAPIQVSENVIGYVKVGMSTRHLQKNLISLTQEGLVYTLVAILLGALIAWILGNNLTRRIKSLIEATQQIDPEKAHQRFTDIDNDEIGNLMRNFNQMEEKIHQQFQENRSNLKEIEKLAYNDTLTGLSSRALLEEELSSTIHRARKGHYFSALLFLDVDKFKQLNDSYGHELGDLLLQKIANRILQVIETNGQAFRFGGDEFVIIYENIGETLYEASLHSQKLAKALHEALGKPYQLDDLYHKTSVSIGIDLFDGQQDFNINEVIRRADIALYASKESGRNQVTLFETEMENKVKDDLLLEEGLENAVAKNEFYWLLQPQIEAKTGKIVGAEVLLRWIFRGELISPARFIPLAEDNLTIIPISNWLFESVFAFVEQHRLDQRLTVSINLSPKHFFDPKLVETMERLLDTYAVRPEAIKLEITEGVFLENLTHSIYVLKQLKELGFHISLDDFGTGFSSLSYLKNLPIDQLKIDKSFVDELPNQIKAVAIAKTIINLTDHLNINVIAEGVETQEQVDFLTQNACELCQGYFFHKPIKQKDFLTLIQTEK
ncbi:putative bifunctional diguanylate cyclase/phosphodiesterase [Hydrogenovibrio halophilus]|uniref:putative bifunctional diguanylate cyclase/phosphodiesterase n=1 Tax=Hydrogenovibrio halophilus TaxID=373391 RepID=UPI0003607028|nr:bifunctional diguanylate cyclase/phosphodiesterase [Hydrogenovibrio halophilus]